MSVSKIAKRRGTILDEIMHYHRQRLPKVMREVPLADLRALASIASPAADFRVPLSKPGVSVIAECKKASPSKGLLDPNYDPVALANTFVRGGASAISVLTDKRHFQGSLEDLTNVKGAVEAINAQIPVLRKDFIFHPYQVYEARAAGADALLLIVAVLEVGELKDLLELTHELGMEALVEIHTEAELERVAPLYPRVIGINNRNLQTFEVDFDNTNRLRGVIPEGVVVVGESGIKSADDVRLMREIGVDAVLVGESLIRSNDARAMLRELVIAGRV